MIVSSRLRDISVVWDAWARDGRFATLTGVKRDERSKATV